MYIGNILLLFNVQIKSLQSRYYGRPVLYNIGPFTENFHLYLDRKFLPGVDQLLYQSHHHNLFHDWNSKLISVMGKCL